MTEKIRKTCRFVRNSPAVGIEKWELCIVPFFSIYLQTCSEPHCQFQAQFAERPDAAALRT